MRFHAHTARSGGMFREHKPRLTTLFLARALSFSVPPGVVAALVCEKLGRHAEALPYIENLMNDDWPTGGNTNLVCKIVGRTIQGRVYSQLDQRAHATAAFEQAAQDAHGCGVFSSPFCSFADMHASGLSGAWSTPCAWQASHC
eukprot:COSAG02_NODE_4130_length_5740_cov_3.273888_3_plen_144_part_00